ncbi:MAG TPA: adenylyl-sulfate kinase [Elusimicrobia bacterium]|nr:adenylyl-sulfate kinase [Elusimicrobiota bacterium]
MTPLLRLVIVGHVDHGKSTLIGRLFHDSGKLPEGKLEQLKAAAERRGMEFEWANLMDGLQAERDQNVTIDTAQIWFRTPKREAVIIDAPGHKEFLKNMVTGAASADAALLVVAADEGVQEQTRRHASLLTLLGLRQVAVVVNKMDSAGFTQAAFDKVRQDCSAFFAKLGLEPRAFIPISARHGDNVVSPSTKMPWHSGPTLLESLDTFSVPAPPEGRPLRFPVQDVYRFDDRRIIVGRIESGTLRVGDRLLFSPRDKTSVVKTIERWPTHDGKAVTAGMSVGITLAEQIYVERGQVGSHEEHPPIETDVFDAKVFWLGKDALEVGRPYTLKLATQDVECRVQSIEKIVDPVALTETPGGGSVPRDAIAEVSLRTRTHIALDDSALSPATGRFVLAKDGLILGGGIVSPCRYPDRRSALAGIKSRNLSWTEGKVGRKDREGRNRHRGTVLWMTGLSGSGKSAIGVELERELFRMGLHTYFLDGDNVRHGLSSNLGFSPEDRAENIRRTGEVAKLFLDSGAVVITAFISPYRDDRQLARSIVPEGDFVEIFLDCPLEVCETRDTKGLYRKARSGEIRDFTGISAPYERPEKPEITLRTDRQSIAESVAQVIDYLKSRVLKPSA